MQTMTIVGIALAGGGLALFLITWFATSPSPINLGRLLASVIIGGALVIVGLILIASSGLIRVITGS